MESAVTRIRSVSELIEAAHDGGLVTQEWNYHTEFGPVEWGIAFDLDGFAEAAAEELAMSAEELRDSFGEWLGDKGFGAVASIVSEWLGDLYAGRVHQRLPKVTAREDSRGPVALIPTGEQCRQSIREKLRLRKNR